MGCDIHIVIQRQNANGAWREVPYQRVWRTLGHEPIGETPVAPDVFLGRNYDLFGILANVRNGRGFAGTETGRGWPSIAPDRGWPDDFVRETVLPDPRWPEEGARYMGDHSFTWVTLDELKAFPWDSTVTELYGVVRAEDYERLVSVGDTPDSYCGDVAGPGIQVYDPNAYAQAKIEQRLAPNPYVRMAWHETARAATGDWPGQVIPWLEQLAEGRSLRLVIGFDS